MRGLNKPINIPSYLQELHGKQATGFDLALTYAVAVLITLTVLYLAAGMQIPIWQLVILVFLAFDLSGGVVANFSKGTSAYYAENIKRRYAFMGFHVLQPMLIIWIFPTDWICIALLASYSILGMVVVNAVQDTMKQLLLAVFFVTAGIGLAFVMPFEKKIVLLMLVLFVIKLVLAFPINWLNADGKFSGSPNR